MTQLNPRPATESDTPWRISTERWLSMKGATMVAFIAGLVTATHWVDAELTTVGTDHQALVEVQADVKAIRAEVDRLVVVCDPDWTGRPSPTTSQTWNPPARGPRGAPGPVTVK